jgi:integrase/recombinase XerD
VFDKESLLLKTLHKKVRTSTELSKKAGIGNCTQHDLRRTFITNQLEKGVDINRVSKMAGHCDITTTAIYDRRGY